MLSLQRVGDIPEFLLQRSSMVYGNTLHLQIGRQRLRTSLVLCRNLKFYEFRNKELIHHIDLRNEREAETKDLLKQLEDYTGPLSSFLIREDLDRSTNKGNGSFNYSMLEAVEDQPLEIGKYVWLGEHIYVLIRCWHVLIVLKRPFAHGAKFELEAIHKNFQHYKLVCGPEQYQAYVELHFRNGKRLLTNFQSPDKPDIPGTSSGRPQTDSSVGNFKNLLMDVHQLQCQLSTQRSQTQRDIARAQDLHVFGVPNRRSPLLEEKQLLRRYGDIWTRVCGGDRLVIGCMLANIAGSHRLSIIQNLRPVLELAKVSTLVSSNLNESQDHEDGVRWSLEYRLYELPRQPNGEPPEDYNELAQFWACQEQEQQYSNLLNWRPISASSFSSSSIRFQNQLMPESTAVLLVSMLLSDLIEVEKLELLLSYEVGLKGATQQLHVSTIDVGPLLSQPELHAPSFAPSSLHQDFLAVIMTQPAQCALCLKFLPDQQQQASKFEQMLISNLGFELTTHKPAESRDLDSQSNFLDDNICADISAFDCISAPSATACNTVQRILYNRQNTSQWCGLLLIHRQNHIWHIYAQSVPKMKLFLYRLQRDLLQFNCNLSIMDLDDRFNGITSTEAAIHLEATLREELNVWRQLMGKLKQDEMKHLTRQLNQMQMVSDKMASVIRRKSEQQHHLD